MKRKVLAFILAVLFLLPSAYALAHSGRTDSKGGHYNRSTGEYHYHHGYSAHQHPGGVCPYDYDDRTGRNSGSSSSSSDSAMYAVFGETATPKPTTTPKPTPTSTPHRTSYTYTPRPESTPYSYYLGEYYVSEGADTGSHPINLSHGAIVLIAATLVFVLLGVVTTLKKRTKEEKERLAGIAFLVLLFVWFASLVAATVFELGEAKYICASCIFCIFLLLFIYHIKEKTEKRRGNRVQKEKLSVRIKAFFTRHHWIIECLYFAVFGVAIVGAISVAQFLFGYLPTKYSEEDMQVIKDEARHEGYQEGYQHGLNDCDEDSHSIIWNAGHAVGYEEGYESCKNENYTNWYNTGVDAGYKAGFDAGYNIGYEHRDEHIDQYTSGMLPLLWGEKPYSSRNNLPELAVGSYKPGVYTASAFGFGGIVEVEVVISANGRIVEVNIDAPNETLGIGSRAIEELPEQIIVTQGVNMDVVTGATRTSKAILDPVTNILTKQAIQ